ncbi:hypothetical protein RhiLY_12133 [Ceratobasidium sp. AG-Ba]|nr:hypothetical protein RhiLY_12133 [Ceratobasidium sp. AG-Ba]
MYSSSWERYTTNANMTSQYMYFGGSADCTKTVNSSISFNFYVNTAGPANAWASQQLVWSVTGLSPAYHTVTVTHVGIAGQWTCFDFLMYLPSSASPVTSSPTATSSPDSSSSQKATVGAIAGGVTGGIVLVVLLVAGVLLYRRRQYRRPAGSTHHETYAGDMAYQSKQADPPYADRHLPPAPALDRTAHSPYVNASTGGRNSISPTVWTGKTYMGLPELQ